MQARSMLGVGSLFALLAAACVAQEFRATVSGTVTDPAGAAVAGARVTVVSVDTNVASQTVTNEAGRYLIPFLVPGNYRLLIEAPGFKSYERSNIVLRVNDRVAVDVRLELGALSERITVTERVSPLETETATRGGLVSRELLLNVPNGGRNLFQLTFAMPGVVKPRANQGAPFDLDGIANSRATISGASGGLSGYETNTETLIDGVTDSKGDRGLVMVPALEAVQEFRVLANPYDAQYGRTGGGVLITTTKSGTNEFHGAVFDRYYDTRLNANTWENNRLGIRKPEPAITQHNYGFQVNGPVWVPKLFDGRNKIFFMLSYDSNPSSSDYVAEGTVPTAEMKAGDFSGVLAADGRPVTIFDPLTTRLAQDGKGYVRDPFPGNRIPVERRNPVGAKILSYYPEPTGPGIGPAKLNNFAVKTRNETSLWQWIGRLDIRAGDRHAFFGRYGETNMERTGDRKFPPGNPAESSTILPRGRRGRTMTLDWTALLSPSTTWNLRGGFARQENLVWNSQSARFNPAELGFPASLVSQFTRLQFPQISAGTYMAMGAAMSTTADDTYSLQPNISLVRGTHVLKIGAEARDFRSTSSALGAASGRYSFGKDWTQGDPTRPDAYSGNEIATLLLGYPSGGSVDINIAPAWRSLYWVLYVQDDWKVTRRLTVNLGLRWDYDSPVVERYNRMNRGFAFDQPSPLADKVRSAAGVENCPACKDLRGGILFAGTRGRARMALERDLNNFQPRIGVAFAASNKTVLRGGFGVFKMGAFVLGNTAGFSRTTPLVASLDGLTPAVTLSNPFPQGLLKPVGSSLGLATDLGLAVSFNYLDFDLPTSYQCSFGFQRELWGRTLLDLSYVGNFSTGMPVTAGLNYIPLDYLYKPVTYYTERVINPFAGLLPNNAAMNGPTILRSYLLTAYPQYSSVTMNNIPIGKNRYDSMQMSVRRAFEKGLEFQVNYTISKTLERLQFLNATDYNPQDPKKPHSLDKRLAVFEVPQKLSLLGVYHLPVGRGRALASGMPGWLNAVVGGWRLGWNITYQSGFPVDFPNAAPLEPRSAKLPPSQRSLYRWFDTSLFPRVAGPAPYTLRNFPTRFPDVRFMGVRNWDLSVAKEVPVVGERVNVQLRADLINAFNRPFFTQMATNPPNVTRADFGQLRLMQDNTPRIVYLEFKLAF